MKISKVRPEPDYRLYLEFEDGVKGTIDLTDRLFGEVFEPLKSMDVFSQVSIDEFGAVCWPNGADLAPDGLYEKLSRNMASHAPTEAA